MNALELQLYDIQGRLFELSVDRNLDSARFIKIFMNSETARALIRHITACNGLVKSIC